VTDTSVPVPRPEQTEDVADKMVQHLLRQPCDLIDARRLMRAFHASADDFQQVLRRLEEGPWALAGAGTPDPL
jgi:hypothetical protein